jgi:signal recognition particle subunit SEC65|tara:strand:- start:107 stop:490 length:384 start_codon:yes stop_codon:yes gene_type:complete
MSHFSTINTKIKNRPELVEALELLQYNVVQDVELENPLDHEHRQWNVDVAINDDIGFRLNKNTGTYELVADKQTWNLDVPVERFIDKVTQQYARMTIHNTVKELGYTVDEEWEMDDNSIELTVSRWD